MQKVIPPPKGGGILTKLPKKISILKGPQHEKNWIYRLLPKRMAR